MVSTPLAILIVGFVVFAVAYVFTDGKVKQFSMIAAVVCGALFLVLVLLQVLGVAGVG